MAKAKIYRLYNTSVKRVVYPTYRGKRKTESFSFLARSERCNELKRIKKVIPQRELSFGIYIKYIIYHPIDYNSI